MIAHAPHVAVGSLLVAAALWDLRTRHIPNAITGAVALVGAAVSLVDTAAPTFRSSIAAFGVVFACALIAWRARLWGGGDAKLAAAAATWVGVERLSVFALAVGLAGGALSILFYALTADARRTISANLVTAEASATTSLRGSASTGRDTVPYGVAIAAGTLYAVLGPR